MRSKLEPEVEFRHQGAFFRIPFWRHVSADDQDIVMKFGVCVDNGVSQRVKWSKYVCLKNLRWRTAAKSN